MAERLRDVLKNLILSYPKDIQLHATIPRHNKIKTKLLKGKFFVVFIIYFIP